MNVLKELLLRTGLLLVPLAAQATPVGLSLQGRLVKDEMSISGPVELTVSISSPNTDRCLLYQETHQLNLSASEGGVFSVTIGAGTRTSEDKGFSLANVFSNTGKVISGLSCPGGAANSYTPSGSDTRYIYLNFNTPQGAVAFNDPYVVQSVPYAIEAERLNGKLSSEYLQTTATTTQEKLNDIMTAPHYADLLDLITGASTKYMSTANTGPTKLPVLSSSPSSPSAGQIWYEGGSLKYYNGSQVQTVGSAENSVIRGGQTGALTLGTSDANNFSINTSNTPRMTVLANGNVGIGTISPTAILDVLTSSSAGSIRIKSPDATNPNNHFTSENDIGKSLTVPLFC